VSKYAPLHEALRGSGVTRTMTLDEIADLVGGLPRSAYSYVAWWSNDDQTHVQSRAWTEAGYLAQPDLAAKTVRFTHR
jgi:hypothetical protein